jgi:pimeloyl-ACP methyl ester carboxylesterase
VQQRALSSELRTYADDLRGHGDTSIGDADGTLDQLGGDLIELLEALGLEPRALVGYSLGGTVVLWVAATRPDLVSRVVAIGSSSVVGSRAADGYRETIDLVRSGDRDAIQKSFREHTLLCLHRKDAIDVDAAVAQDLAALGSGDGYCNACEAMAGVHDRPLTPLLEDVRCPTLIVGGEHDVFCPRKAQDIMVEALPDARYVEMKGVGHYMTVEDRGPYRDPPRVVGEERRA